MVAPPIICFIGFLRSRTNVSSAGLGLGQNSGRYDTRTRYQATNRLTKIPEKGLFGVFFGEPSDFKRLKKNCGIVMFRLDDIDVIVLIL